MEHSGIPKYGNPGGRPLAILFRVDGNHLVTDQPSHQQEEKTESSFDAEGNLVLEYDGNKSWFTRV